LIPDIFSLQIKHNNCLQTIVKSLFAKELKEVFLKATLTEVGLLGLHLIILMKGNCVTHLSV